MTVLAVNERPFAWESASPEATAAMGEMLGQLLQPGDLVALFGELGSGKTVLVRGMAAGLGCRSADVHSPSFTLVNEYPCRPGAAGSEGLRLAHVDLYRIGSPEELPGIGWDAYLGPDYVVAVEWPDRALAWLPPDHVRVAIETLDDTRRRLRCAGTGARSASLVREWFGAISRSDR